MKRKRPSPSSDEQSSVVRENPPELAIPPLSESASGMVRTQIYLTAQEHAFLQREAARTGETMASLIRSYIDEKMEVPDDVWASNPLLDPPAEDPAWVGHEDGSINHDHYVAGAPKRYQKVRGQWVEQPVGPE